MNKEKLKFIIKENNLGYILKIANSDKMMKRNK